MILAFYKGRGDWRDWVIRTVTRSPYSHVEILHHAPHMDEAVCTSASKRDGDMVRTKVVLFKEGHWDFVPVSTQTGKALDRIRPANGLPYDTIGALIAPLRLPVSLPGRWFCSELAAHAVGLSSPHKYTPGRLYHVLSQIH